MEGSEGSNRREAFLIISAAVVLSALLQLVVFEQYSTERLGTLVVIVGLFLVLLWTFLGGYARAVAWRENRKLHRHLREHPEMVSQLRALIDGTGEVLGDRGSSFAMIAMSVLNEWDRVAQQPVGLGESAPFTQSQKDLRNQASSFVSGFGIHSVSWPVLRNAVTRNLETRAGRDAFDFLFAADLLGSYISTARTYISNFTLMMQQAGAAKLSAPVLAQWSKYAKKVNALLDEAEKVARASPDKIGLGVSLSFERVDDNLAYRPDLAKEGSTT